MNGERLYLIDDPEMGIVAEKDPEVIARHKRRYEWAADYCAMEVLRGVVDAGCGTGYGAEIFDPATLYIGVDGDPDTVSYAQKHYSTRRRQFYDGTLLDTAAMKAGFVVCLEALEHVERDQQQAFIHTCGQGDNELLIATPVNMGQETSNPHHKHEPTIEELSTWLLDAGYTPTITLERYESTYGPAVQALVVARPS